MRLFGLMSAAFVSLSLAPPTNAAEQPHWPSRAEYQSVVSKAIRYLRLTGQREDGSFSPELGPGVTAIVVTGALNSGVVTHREPWIQKSLRYLEQFVRPEGGIYKDLHDNYVTSVSLLAFHAANADGRYDDLIANAQGYLKKIQWDESEGLNQSNSFYGGQGYGKHKRPDMSNTQFAVESQAISGLAKDDPFFRKALVFLSRAQNLPGERNQQEFASKATPEDLGGIIYTPAGKGESKAGDSPTGGLRSYGSMTYAGLKSMIYAGVDRNDPRIKAGIDWIRRHWSVDENPGLGQMGLYYYYHTLAKCLDIYGEDPFLDSDGKPRYWRIELFEAVKSRQRSDGTWINLQDRWYEGDPNLVTGYVLMGLSHINPAKAKTEPAAK